MADFALYRKYHLDRADERQGMFAVLARHYDIHRALYPGCFVHVTPSFIFPQVTYVDTEKRAAQFFETEAEHLISNRKVYAEIAAVQFHHQDYAKPLPEPDESFELVISQYAGFVSQHCKRYLKVGGLLVANNSHGDASMAHIDGDYEVVAVIKRRGEKFSLGTDNLDEYFIPKKDVLITKAYLEKIQRGIGYQKSSFAYLFRRCK